MTSLSPATNLTGRTLIAAIFLISGMGKIAGYSGTVAYMESVGVPGALLLPTIVLEIGGALAIIAGWRTRLTAVALAAFSLLAGILFHGNFADPMQQIMFLKNVAIAGGFLFLAANGAGAWSLDARRVRA
ncbi:MAG TPA: DoxX family protein [Steroidobacteraceae bacterium]|nr:DoxX family protein [Steroidobacteraceae bacterium]